MALTVRGGWWRRVNKYSKQLVSRYNYLTVTVVSFLAIINARIEESLFGVD